MRKVNLIKMCVAAFSAVILMVSCERTHINLGEKNIFTRLDAFIGENETEISRQMRHEGYKVVSMFENSTNYLEKGGSGQYAIVYTEDKTVYGSSYFNTASFIDSVAFADNSMKYAEWRKGAEEKNCENYRGTIAAKDIVDFDSLFISKTEINDSVTALVYDNEDFFSSVYEVNRKNVQSMSEVWYNGKPGTEKEYMIEYKNEVTKNTVSIMVADGTLKQ